MPTTDGSHLGEALHDYVDGLLDDAEELRVERHLLVCAMCRCAAEQERALVASLRSFQPDPHRHQDLVAGLLGMAAAAPPPPPAPARRQPTMVTWDAPPQYHSARRSLCCTLLAVAGCLGAALVVVNVPTISGSGGDVRGPAPAPATVQLSTLTGGERLAPLPAIVGGATSAVVPTALTRAAQDARDAVDQQTPPSFSRAGAVRMP